MQPSARLVRAVAAERAELERHRARLHAEADELRAALARIEHGLTEIDERCELLERLAPAPEPRKNRRDAVLRGPAIREAAVKVLVDARPRLDPLPRVVRAARHNAATRSPARTRSPCS